MRSKVAVVAGAIGWLFLSAGVASANEDEDMLIRRAIQLRKQGNDRAALEDLKHAYGITQSPRAAAQLGFAEQALGMWPQAEEHVREALGAPEDKWIRQNQATLEEALATIRAHLGRVLVEGGQPGAQVTVNGQSVGSLPLADAVSVAAGSVDIEVRAAGYAPALKTVKVAPGEYARVPFTLQPVARPGSQARTNPPPFSPPHATPPARYAPVPAPPSTAPVPTTVLPLSSPPPEPPPELSQTHEDRGRRQRIAGISLIAGGVAAIGGGVAASVIANNKFDAIGADAAADRPYNDSNGNWKGYETAAAALYVLGGAAVVGGVVLYTTGRPSAEERRPSAASSVSFRPVLTPSRASANVSVRF